MKIMVFLHGTIIMHRGAVGRTRDERVRQVLLGLTTFQTTSLCSQAAQRLSSRMPSPLR